VENVFLNALLIILICHKFAIFVIPLARLVLEVLQINVLLAHHITILKMELVLLAVLLISFQIIKIAQNVIQLAKIVMDLNQHNVLLVFLVFIFIKIHV
jgi:hypothetical protein